MPSSLKQRVIIIDAKNKKTGKTTSIALIQKTGYVNLTMNGQRFCYNKSDHYPMTQKKNVSSFITPASKKRTIVITRKR